MSSEVTETILPLERDANLPDLEEDLDPEFVVATASSSFGRECGRTRRREKEGDRSRRAQRAQEDAGTIQLPEVPQVDGMREDQIHHGSDRERRGGRGEEEGMWKGGRPHGTRRTRS